MTEQTVVEWVAEYVLNGAWQIPLLASGAWLLVRVTKPSMLVQHGLWLAVLVIGVVLPAHGIEVRPPGMQEFAGKVPVEVTPDQSRVERPLRMQRGLLSRATKQSTLERVASRMPHIERRILLNSAATRWLVLLYAMAVFVGGLRLVRGLLAMRRLVRRSRKAVLAPHTTHVLAELCHSLNIAMPRMLESDEIDGPVVLSAVRPVLLLPVGFEAHAEEEVRAAILHEFAHVRRRDYAVNLFCQVAGLPVSWHPVIYAVQQRISKTREMLCDTTAAQQMASGAEYAQCLISLARQMVGGASTGIEMPAMGLFGNKAMEERVMNLIEKRVEMKIRSRVWRGVCGCAAIVMVASAAATFHVRPTFAATETAAQRPYPSATPPAIEDRHSPQLPVPDAGTLAAAHGDHAKVTAGNGEYVHRWNGMDGEPFTIVNSDAKEPSVEERQKIERQVAESLKEADEELKWVNGPKFQAEMAELQKNLNRAKMRTQIEAAKKLANDPATKLRMEALQKELLHLNAMPELKKFDDAEWQKQFAELQKGLPDFKYDFDFDKQMASANSALNQARLNETIEKAMKGNAEQMAKMQEQMEHNELKAKLDEATRLLEEVRKRMEAIHAK